MSTTLHASSKTDADKTTPNDPDSSGSNAVKHVAQTADSVAMDILLFLIAFRILNALTIQTFFQPDEYFQSLEPAWQMIYGMDSGTWITWEWNHHLRSALHPTLFAIVYWLANLVASSLTLAPPIHAELLLVAPKAVQAVVAALGDYYTWKLAQRVYGQRSNEAAATLALSVVSPWQWFCSTRTLSNCLEMTLTVLALYNWPWHWATASKKEAPLDAYGLKMRDEDAGSPAIVDEITRLRRSLLSAALAIVLRPTNILIWFSLSFVTFIKPSFVCIFLRSSSTAQTVQPTPSTALTLLATKQELRMILQQALICGTSVLGLETLIDRLYYEVWTLPPLNFLYFNIIQSLAVFYGRNDWHYYLSQGYPLLLVTALPWTTVGIQKALRLRKQNPPRSATEYILSQTAIVVLLVPALLSLISHKEVRFIYPLLPLLHILTAQPLSNYFAASLAQPLDKRLRSPRFLVKRTLLVTLIAFNVSLALYTTTVHNGGVIHVMAYLRQKYESYYIDAIPPRNLTAAFLMPCHSTPWRSHLLYPPSASQPGISAWALTCEPPLHLDTSAKASYIDEADVFYADPVLWLRKNMARDLPRSHSSPSILGANAVPRKRGLLDHVTTNAGERDWPDHLIFFEQLQSVMQTALTGSGYRECWRGFNSHWHNDWRRTGDVVVWCLSPQRKVVEDQGKGFWVKLKGMRDDAWWAVAKRKENRGPTADAFPQYDLDIKAKTPNRDRGPWGVGQDMRQRQERKPSPLGDSVEETGSRKTRVKEPARLKASLWGWIWPRQNRTRWWERNVWS